MDDARRTVWVHMGTQVAASTHRASGLALLTHTTENPARYTRRPSPDHKIGHLFQKASITSAFFFSLQTPDGHKEPCHQAGEPASSWGSPRGPLPPKLVHVTPSLCMCVHCCTSGTCLPACLFGGRQLTNCPRTEVCLTALPCRARQSHSSSGGSRHVWVSGWVHASWPKGGRE